MPNICGGNHPKQSQKEERILAQHWSGGRMTPHLIYLKSCVEYYNSYLIGHTVLFTTKGVCAHRCAHMCFTADRLKFWATCWLLMDMCGTDGNVSCRPGSKQECVHEKPYILRLGTCHITIYLNFIVLYGGCFLIFGWFVVSHDP